MNTIVKSFIVVNLILSAIFCAFTMVQFTNRVDWKAKFYRVEKELGDEQLKHKEDNDRNQALIEKKQTEIDGISKELKLVEGDRKKYSDELQTAETSIAELKKDIKEKELKNDELLGQFQKKSDELGKAMDELEKTREAEQNARTLMIDLKGQIVTFEKERNDLITDLSMARSDREKLEDKLKEKEWVLGKLREHGVDPSQYIAREGEPETPIHAKVLSVMPNVEMVMLSVGEQDKVKPGYRFTIYRGGTYIGKVQVEAVYPRLCSAKIDGPLQAENQIIQEGDNASTRVY